MVSLRVDFGFAFDFLAILMVKNEKGLKVQEQILDATRDIRDATGDKKLSQILASEEFDKLIAANRSTFEAVDKAKLNMITSKEVDDWNTKRFHCKKALQKKFFTTPLREKKNKKKS